MEINGILRTIELNPPIGSSAPDFSNAIFISIGSDISEDPCPILIFDLDVIESTIRKKLWNVLSMKQCQNYRAIRLAIESRQKLTSDCILGGEGWQTY